MGNIYCKKCGMDAFGKCPQCRSVFPENFVETEKEQKCDHDFHYKSSQEKCIYGCGYVSPLIYAGQF